MRRREFITLLGGASAAWPRAARAQQPAKVPRVGILSPAANETAATLTAFREGIRNLGGAALMMEGILRDAHILQRRWAGNVVSLFLSDATSGELGRVWRVRLPRQ